MTRQPSDRDPDAALLAQLRELLGLVPSSPSLSVASEAWAIDVAAARILAANRSGAARFGMRDPETPLALDAAMPALRRLHELAGRIAPGGEVRETLLFWTAEGAETIAASISTLPGNADIVIVRAHNDGADQPTQPAPPGAGSAEPPPVPRDDAATLREIARRIREGQGRSRLGIRDLPAGSDGERSVDTPAPTGAAQIVDIAKLGHELKTPISAIIAASEIMRDQRLGPIGNERYRGYASDIHDSARHALAVINSMLGRSDAVDDSEAGPRSAAEQPQLFAQLDINALVEGTVSAMRPLAANAGVSVVSSLSARLPNVIADPVSVRQILLNLLTNAIKFTPTGGHVTASTAYTLDGPVSLCVRDTGPGMSEAEIARALAPVDPTPQLPAANPHRSAREGGGLGIGLPLVRQLAEANGATVDIESTAGLGTAVTVSFARGRVVPV